MRMTKEKGQVEVAQEKLGQFRQKVYKSFARLKDAALDLLDGLSSRDKANSPVELSLNSQFQRGHGSVYQAIAGCYGADEAEKKAVLQSQREAVGSILPEAQERSHVLLVTDVTPRPRPDGQTVADRSYLYTAGGHIQAGHNYSVLGFIPEGDQPHSWCVPLALERVPSDQNKELFGIEQALIWAEDKNLPFHKQLIALAADRAYSSRTCLYTAWQQANLVLLTRLRHNQVVYHQPEAVLEKKSGHPRWYGQAFRLNQPHTWTEPSTTYQFERGTSRGKVERISVKAWSNMLLRGKHKPARLPLHECPFTLVQVITYRQDGSQKYKNPLWLIAFGQRQAELTLPEIVADYFQRPNIEHFNRFAKQDILFTSFHTSETAHEENWGHLVALSYVQLYLAQPLAQVLPKPWQNHLPQFQGQGLVYTPAMVQSDFARIIQAIGSPAKHPKRRGNSSGRPQGSTKPPRPRQEVVKKGKKRKKRKK